MIKLPLQVKEVIPKDLSHFLTHCLLRENHINKLQGFPTDDDQIPGAAASVGHSTIFETVNERIWPFLENILEEELIPTYSYARLYTNGNELRLHSDRPSCEISVTIQLGRSHHYSWPIYMGDQRFDMGECDAVIYPGTEVLHWRNPCDGPEGYYSGQVFCHYVRADGKYKDWAGDRRFEGEIPFFRYRTINMETK